MYEYKVKNVARVIDGDTFDLDLDLGFYARLRVRVRLLGIDTYEIYGRNAHPLGREARRFVVDWMAARTPDLGVRTVADNPSSPVADGGFGRWAGEVFDASTGALLADALRTAGYDDNEGE